MMIMLAVSLGLLLLLLLLLTSRKMRWGSREQTLSEWITTAKGSSTEWTTPCAT